MAKITLTLPTISGGGDSGNTNLSYISSPAQGIVTSDTGTDATIPLADGTNAGLLSSVEKAEIATALQPSDIAGLVPYTGATTDVDLGEFQLKTGQLEFDQTPTGTAGIAKLRWNDSDGTLDLGLKGGNVTLQLGQEQIIRIVNKTGVNLLESAYQVIYISGAQGNRLKVDLALANSDLTSTGTIGLVTETINNNQEGFITSNGLVRGINTTGSLQGETWADGDVLYVSASVAGKLTNVKPIAPQHTVTVGILVSAHATQGSIFVKVDNGYELEELHNVLINTPLNNDTLVYETSTGLWKNKTISTALGYTPENVANKQNSLAVDGTATKYVTVDAVNKEFFLPAIIGDNQPQIQAKIDALFALGGGVVRLGSGNYTINSSIRLKDGVSIKGVAPKFNFNANCPDLNFTLNGGTRITAMSAGLKGLVANEIDSEGVDSGIKALSNVFIEDLGLKGFEIAIKVGAHNQLGFGMGGLNRIFIDGTGADNITVVTKKAIELYNSQQMSSDMVLMYKVRNGLIIANNKENVTCSSGNSVWSKTYVYLDPSSTSEKSTVISAITTGTSTTITTTTANELDVNDLVQLNGVTGADGNIVNRVHTVSEIISPTQFKVQTNTTGKIVTATGTVEKGRAGIHLKASGNEPLNHITFYSPQVNVFLPSYQNKAIVNIALTGTLLSRLGAIGLYHTDTEGLTDHHLYLDGTSNITHKIGTMIDAPPLGHIAVYNTDGASFESVDTDVYLKFGDTRINDGNNAIKYNGSYKGYRSFSRFPSLGLSDDIINNKTYIAGNSGFQALEVNSYNYTVGTPVNGSDTWMPFRLMAKRATAKLTGSGALSIDRLGYLQCENSSDITVSLPKIGTGFLEVPVGVPVTLNKVSGAGKINIVGFTGQTVGGKSVADGGFELSSLLGGSVTLMASGFSDWVILGTNKDNNLGKITIIDLAGTKFTNLNTAHNYVQAYTSAVISEETYSNGVYRFTVPQNTSFSVSTSFLHNSACSFIDNLGLVTSFGQGAFVNNTGSSVFGNATFGDDSFTLTTGKYIFGNCTFANYSFFQATGEYVFGNILGSGATGLIGYESNGIFTINGDIGTTNAGNYADFFNTSTSIIYAKKSKLTSNAGAVEGDLLKAFTYGCSVFFGGEKYSQDLKGTPTAPTATAGTNTTQIATMAALYAATTTELAYALADETANLTVSTRIKFRMPFAMTLSEVRISLNDAPTLSSVVVDVKENGVSIFSTLLSIDASEKTSITAATPAVISDVNLADDAEITVSTTQIGSGDTGKGLKILFKGRKA